MNIVERKKIVPVIQREAGHDECVAALVHSLNLIGFRAMIFMPRALTAKRGSIFEFADIKHQVIEFEDLKKTDITILNKNVVVYFHGKKDPIIIKAFDCFSTLFVAHVFFTTFDKTDYQIAEKLSSRVSINAFVHGPHQKNNLAQLLAYKNTRAIVFSRRMENFLLKQNLSAEQKGVFYLSCITDSDQHAETNAEVSKQRLVKFVIPGKVDNRTRNYSKIIELLRSISAASPAPIKFLIAGGIGEYGLEFKSEVERLNLQKYVEFPFYFDHDQTSQLQKFADYQDIKKLMSESHFSLDISRIDFNSAPKVSGTINLCIDRLIPVFYFDKFSVYSEFSWPNQLQLEKNSETMIAQILESSTPKNLLEIKQKYMGIKQKMCDHNASFLSKILL